MSDPRRFIRPLAAVVALLLLLGGGALAYNQIAGDDDTYQLTAYFEKAIGLFENSDVNILGVPVGKVTAVEPEGSRVRVEMEVDSEYKVPADAIAQIVPISVISDRYVQLAPVYTGGPTLENGAEIPVENTYIPAELDDVFKQLKKLLEAIEPGEEGEPGALGNLIVQLDKTLKDREEDLKGTLISGSRLTDTLADAQDDISDLLINLEDIFGKVSTRAKSFGTLNRNFALVMAALAESQDDITGTLVNLGAMTDEVGKLLEEHGDRLGGDVRLAANVLKKVLENRASVEESLDWLPVLGRGITAAYNPPPISAIDVRDNNQAKLECEFLAPLPPSPVKDELRKHCRDVTGEPGGGGGERGTRPAAPPAPGGPTSLLEAIDPALLPDLLKELDCDRGVRKVKRQLGRVDSLGLPDDVKSEILRPLRKQLRQLKAKCRELGEAIEDAGLLDGVGGIPSVDDTTEDLGELSGAASGDIPAPVSGGTSAWQRLGDWFGGLLSYVGVAP